MTQVSLVIGPVDEVNKTLAVLHGCGKEIMSVTMTVMPYQRMGDKFEPVVRDAGTPVNFAREWTIVHKDKI